MKPKYFETYDYRRYKDYCSNKCINIVFEQNDKEDKERQILRGEYKGYLYGMKLFNTLLLRGKSIKNYEVYNHFKHYKSHKTTLYGETKAIIDIMQLISE